jgi:hypothetical protein
MLTKEKVKSALCQGSRCRPALAVVVSFSQEIRPFVSPVQVVAKLLYGAVVSAGNLEIRIVVQNVVSQGRSRIS